MKYILILLISLPVLAQAQKFEQSYSGVSDISLTTGSGDCEIRKGNGNTVTLLLEHSFGESYKPSIRHNDDRLIIKDGENRGSGSQKYILMIPDNTEIKLTTGSGDLSVEGVILELTGSTGSGNLTLINSGGEISVNNGSGDLKVSDFEGDLTVNVGSGDASLTDYRGELKINCGSGDLEAAGLNGMVNINAGSGDMVLRDVSFTENSSLNAGSGNVEVTLGSPLTASLSINTGSGKGSLNMNGHAFNGTLVMEARKGKGRIEAPFTFDSTEEIEENEYIKIRKTVRLGNDGNKVSMATGSGVAEVKK